MKYIQEAQFQWQIHEFDSLSDDQTQNLTLESSNYVIYHREDYKVNNTNTSLILKVICK